MGKRGRKSAAELAVATVVRVIPRPPAPCHMNDDEAGVWDRLVARMAPDYFGTECHDQLANYCRHVASARYLSGWIERTINGDDDSDILDLDRLLKMRERETRAASALARSLRLTKQATQSPKGSYGARAGDPDQPKPWEPKKR